MIKSITKQFVKGFIQLVETVKYSDGSSVQRILNPKTLIPESVVFIDKDGKRSEGF